ncbi:tyrosine-type recombinase/integrase [Lactovum miscens]|uniref:Integrase n=1 Tax=Lactovum miscens TaxID=190387 RepID=A0A841C914_9LACT|nr:site-specific integrase [Lactovum miscens]MBB5887710.1 integrase [Lactovum miscens]
MWIEKLENGKFKYVERVIDPYTDKARKVSVTLEKDSPQAKKQALALLNVKIDKYSTSTSNLAKMTLEQLYNEWLLRYEQTSKPRSVVSAKTSFKKVFEIIDKDTLIKQADKQAFLNFFDKIYTLGTYSLNYSNLIKAMLSNMFNYAVEREYIDSNPIEKITLKRKSSDKKVHADYLERYEVLDIVNYFNSRNSIMYALITEFLYLTGLRFGELQALQWSNFNGKSIEVTGTLGPYIKNLERHVKQSPKNSSSFRTVDLSKRAIELLEEVKKKDTLNHKSVNGDDYIFISHSSKIPISMQAFNLALKKAGKNLKIDKNLSTHIFRHSHVSLLAELNLPIKAIMERVGHSNSKTTLEIYNHVTQKAKKSVIEALDNLN